MRSSRIKRLAFAASIIGLGFSSASQAARPQGYLDCIDMGTSQFAFDASASRDRDNDIVRYDFSFDNVLVHSQTTPIWMTTVDGSYRVRVAAYDATGMSGRSLSCQVTGTGNSAPIAVDDGPLRTAAGVPLEIEVLANDSDPEGVAITLVDIVTAPNNGEATITGNVVTYTPTVDFGGTDTFRYQITDGLNSAEASVTILVTDNLAPVASNDSYSNVAMGSSVNFSVLNNDSDPDGDVLTLVSVSGAMHGSAEVVGGRVAYIAQSAGAELLSYVISDGEESATAEITFSVVEDLAASNNAPVAQPDTYICNNTSPCLLEVLSNDSDADGDALIIGTFTQPATGVVVADGSEALRYQPAAGFVGETSFTYRATDGLLDSEQVTVSLTVTGAEPVAIEAVAVAGLYVNAGTEGVLLDGSASLPINGILSYQWTQIGGDVQVALSNAATSIASFNAPVVENATLLTFELTVSHGSQSDTTQTAVTVGYVDAPIVVIDTPEQNILEGSTVTLGGRAFFSGELLEEVSWTQLSGPVVEISDSSDSRMSFVVPAIDVADEGVEMRFKLSLADTRFVTAEGEMSNDTITLTVLDNGIDASAFSEGFVTTSAVDDNATPFAFRAQAGTLIALTPKVIDDNEVSSSRPRALPLEAIESEMSTAVGGVAELVFELQEALPEDYSWFVYDESLAQWYDLDVGYEGVSYSISNNRRQVVLRVTDETLVSTRAAGDANAKAGIVTVVSAPGQKSEWLAGSVEAGGGALGGLALLATAALGLVRRRTLAPLALVALTLPVQVAAVEWEYFAGVGFGGTSIERSGDNLAQNLQAGDGPQVTIGGGDSSTLFKAYGGAFFASNLGVRVGFISLGGLDINVGAGLSAGEEVQFAEQILEELPHAGQGISTALQGRFPIADHWMVHSWAGLFAWQNEATVALGSTTATAKDSGVDFFLGVSTEYRIMNDQLGLSLEFERYSQGGDGLLLLGAGAAWYF